MEFTGIDDWYRGAKTFTHFGQKVSYFDNEMDAEALVFVHGFPNSSWDWHKLWPILGDKYRLICLDFIGYGRSDKPSDYEYSVADQADQVFRLLSNLGIKQAHFMGHSSGISVCQEILALVEIEHDPDMVKVLSVCFLNGSVAPTNAPTIMEQRLVKSLGENVASEIDAAFLQNIMGNLAGGEMPLEASVPQNYFDQLMHNDGIKVLGQLLHYVDDRGSHGVRWQDSMCATHIPLFAIIGAQDPVWGRAVEEEVRMALPFMDIEYIEAAGHYVYLQAPEALGEAWQRQVARLGSLDQTQFEALRFE